MKSCTIVCLNYTSLLLLHMILLVVTIGLTSKSNVFCFPPFRAILIVLFSLHLVRILYCAFTISVVFSVPFYILLVFMFVTIVSICYSSNFFPLAFLYFLLDTPIQAISCGIKPQILFLASGKQNCIH